MKLRVESNTSAACTELWYGFWPVSKWWFPARERDRRLARDPKESPLFKETFFGEREKPSFHHKLCPCPEEALEKRRIKNERVGTAFSKKRQKETKIHMYAYAPPRRRSCTRSRRRRSRALSAGGPSRRRRRLRRDESPRLARRSLLVTRSFPMCPNLDGGSVSWGKSHRTRATMGF